MLLNINTLNTPTPRESHVLSLIRRHGPLSRRELHDRTGLRPNTVGEIAGAMLARGLLREGESESVGVGRPRQMLEIDSSRLNVVGIAFEPGRVSAAQLNLHGQRIGDIRERAVEDPEHLVAAACEMVREFASARTLGIGLSILCSLVTACLLGLSMPSLLHALRLDPKVAAGPITLALTDVCTLLFYFNIGKLFLR